MLHHHPDWFEKMQDEQDALRAEHGDTFNRHVRCVPVPFNCAGVLWPCMLARTSLLPLVTRVHARCMLHRGTARLQLETSIRYC